jgi:hypothetical protein
MDVKEIGCDYVDWIHLAKDLAPVNTAMIFRFLKWQKFSDLSRES